jgi:hypothetical protein
MTNNWTITLEEDTETGDLILPLPEDLMQSTGWDIGDTIEWIDNKNGTWTMRKTDGSSTSSAE